MKIPTAIGVIISIATLSYFTVPSNTNHEKQIKSLAYSYGIYHNQNICPNSKKLDVIFEEYKKHQLIKQKDKEWIDANFKRIFEVECLKYEVERSGDDYA